MPVFYLAVSNTAGEISQEVIPKEKKSSGKGLYITQYVAQVPSRFNYLIGRAKAAGLDTVVIDAKMMISKPLLELVKARKLNAQTRVSPDPWLSEISKKLHDAGFTVTARIVVFKDDHLVIARPDLAIKLPGGAIYRDLKYGRWADPYSDEVRLYNELIAEIAAISGVDEVQFDYIRFPAEGAARHAYYSFAKKGVSRVEMINEFLKGVRERVDKYRTSIAVDIFGVTAWQSKNDIENLGQDLKKMAKYIDVISPMFYPSHFHYGYDGFANPGAEPYYFLNAGVKKTLEILSGEAISVVPWIQGFNLRSPNYGPNYIREQIRGCKDEGVNAFLVWNASNNYETTFSALGAGNIISIKN